MSKKDYLLLARVIKQYDSEVDSISNLVYGIAYELQKDNPRFDINKFLIACGITE